MSFWAGQVVASPPHSPWWGMILERVNPPFPTLYPTAPDFSCLQPTTTAPHPSIYPHPFANDLACLHIVSCSRPGHSSPVGDSQRPPHLIVPSLTWRIENDVPSLWAGDGGKRKKEREGRKEGPMSVCGSILSLSFAKVLMFISRMSHYHWWWFSSSTKIDGDIEGQTSIYQCNMKNF